MADQKQQVKLITPKLLSATVKRQELCARLFTIFLATIAIGHAAAWIPLGIGMLSCQRSQASYYGGMFAGQLLQLLFIACAYLLHLMYDPSEETKYKRPLTRIALAFVVGVGVATIIISGTMIHAMVEVEPVVYLVGQLVTALSAFLTGVCLPRVKMVSDADGFATVKGGEQKDSSA